MPFDWEAAYSNWLASNPGTAADISAERLNPSEISEGVAEEWPEYPLWQEWSIEADLTFEAGSILGILLRSGRYFAYNMSSLSALHPLAWTELRRKGVISRFIEWRRNGGGK